MKDSERVREVAASLLPELERLRLAARKASAASHDAQDALIRFASRHEEIAKAANALEDLGL
jgi:hypothetical protein